uniref:class III lanthionine synthetase LanKC N-terminal domain-containing protein n=1 Tax=Mycoplasmopsis agassizii TaxID=33922 RepID=UPI003FA00784
MLHHKFKCDDSFYCSSEIFSYADNKIFGWKIHISSIEKNADEILKKVYFYCLKYKLTFKFISSYENLFMTLTRIYNHEQQGKFITIYFPNQNAIKLHYKNLSKIFMNYNGPLIITNMRKGFNNIVQYRFSRFNFENEKQKSNIEKYSLKSFFFSDDNLFKFEKHKYKFIKMISENNSGFTTLVEKDGEKFILKCIKPYIKVKKGLSYKMIAKNEISNLELLKNSDFVSIIKEYFYYKNHTFIIREYIDGSTLESQKLMFYYGLKSTDKTRTINVIKLIKNLFKTLKKLHQDSIIYNDFHSDNFVYDIKNNKLWFIDFDASYKIKNELKIDNIEFNLPLIHMNKKDYEADIIKLSVMIIGLLTNANKLVESNNQTAYLDYFKYVSEKRKIPNQLVSFLLSIIENPNWDNVALQLSKLNLKFLNEEYRDTSNWNSFVIETHNSLAKEIDNSKSLMSNMPDDIHLKLIFHPIYQNSFWANHEHVEKWLVNKMPFYKFIDLYFIEKNKKKALQFLNDMLVISNGIFYVKNENYFSPNIQDGTALLTLVLFEIYKLDKNEGIFILIEILFNSINNPIQPKINFMHGSAGAMHVVLKLNSIIKKNISDNLKDFLILTSMSIDKDSNKLKIWDYRNTILNNKFMLGVPGVLYIFGEAFSYLKF